MTLPMPTVLPAVCRLFRSLHPPSSSTMLGNATFSTTAAADLAFFVVAVLAAAQASVSATAQPQVAAESDVAILITDAAIRNTTGGRKTGPSQARAPRQTREPPIDPVPRTLSVAEEGEREMGGGCRRRMKAWVYSATAARGH